MATPITNRQRKILTELMKPGMALRWYGHTHPIKAWRGRGFLLLRGNESGPPIAGHTVRALIRDRMVNPANAAQRLPFNTPDTPYYRDYNITDRGRRAAHTPAGTRVCLPAAGAP